MRALGAMVDEGGRDFDEARERCEQAARRDGRALRAFRQRAAAASPASRTYALEIFEELPTSTSILVPIGGGSGACGNCLVRIGARRRRRG